MSSESTKQLKFFQDYLVAQKVKYRCKCLINSGIFLCCCFLIAIYNEYLVIPLVASDSIWIIGISWIFIIITCVLFIQFIYEFKPTKFLVLLTLIVCFFILALVIIPKFEVIYLSIIFPGIIIISLMLHTSREKHSYENIEKCCSHRSNEKHTAIICARNSEIFIDSFDDTAIDLAKGLTRHDQAYQFYLCTSSEMLTEILLNINTTRIWIFGHGTVEGVCITKGSFLLYSSFMLEKI
ncbi:MAG TPA: hypothetical protein O0X69_02650 [Methanocorpusculum sp.]|nr:hypothetical protein [Methanocorpusculum sp.]